LVTMRVGALVGGFVGTGVAFVGALVGVRVGPAVGCFVGLFDGGCVGRRVGRAVGAFVGRFVGAAVGTGVGLCVGTLVGGRVGVAVGDIVVGGRVGLRVGLAAGDFVGNLVGAAVGTGVGLFVGNFVGCRVGLVTGNFNDVKPRDVEVVDNPGDMFTVAKLGAGVEGDDNDPEDTVVRKAATGGVVVGDGVCMTGEANDRSAANEPACMGAELGAVLEGDNPDETVVVNKATTGAAVIGDGARSVTGESIGDCGASKSPAKSLCSLARLASSANRSTSPIEIFNPGAMGVSVEREAGNFSRARWCPAFG
jgi:hypothetical protein